MFDKVRETQVIPTLLWDMDKVRKIDMYTWKINDNIYFLMLFSDMLFFSEFVFFVFAFLCFRIGLYLFVEMHVIDSI